MVSKFLQLHGASPLSHIEVTAHISNAEIDVILKMLQLQWASPLIPFEETFHILNAGMFEIAYLTTCYLKNASASEVKPPDTLYFQIYLPLTELCVLITGARCIQKPTTFAVKNLDMKKV